MLVDCDMDFFEEIAKMRATRRLYAKMMREEFGAQSPRSLAVAITSHTSGLSLTAQRPVNNIVRGAIQALSLVLGGVQALEISAFDEAYRTPSKDAHIVGLRTQQIIDLETGAGKVVDPLGGSYLVESLTDQIKSRIRTRIEEIEAAGDPEQLSASGFFREIFQKAMEDSQYAVEKGDVSVVGVNIHRMTDKDDTLLARSRRRRSKTWHSHVTEIERFKRNRNTSLTCEALGDVAASVANSRNVIAPVIAALEASATMGEIATTMRLCGWNADRYFQSSAAAAQSREVAMSREFVALAIMGVDQHENGVVAVARMLREAQMKVEYFGKFQTPASVADQTIEGDADLVGISCHSWEYSPWFRS